MPLFDGGSRITTYIIYKRLDLYDEREKITSVNAHERTFTITGLRENMDYYFSVCAENAAGLSKPCDVDHAVTPKRPLSKFIFLFHYFLIKFRKILVLYMLEV